MVQYTIMPFIDALRTAGWDSGPVQDGGCGCGRFGEEGAADDEDDGTVI